MTVSELIKELERFDPDERVRIYDRDSGEHTDTNDTIELYKFNNLQWVDINVNFEE